MRKKAEPNKNIFTKQTVEKLDIALGKGNMENLKKQMEKLFTFKNIFNMHDDHLIELAECIVDIYKDDDRIRCAREMEAYAQRRISRYKERKKRIEREKQWADATKNPDAVAMLDLKYRLWVYDAGFEYSRYHMYSILRKIAKEVQKNGGEIEP